MTPTTDSNASSATTTSTSTTTTNTLVALEQQENFTFNIALSPQEQLDSLFSFDKLSGSGSDNSSADIVFHGTQSATTDADEGKHRSDSSQAPLSLFEIWLLDEASGQMEGLMEQLQ